MRVHVVPQWWVVGGGARVVGGGSVVGEVKAREKREGGNSRM